jgi:hypothetical protein
MKKYFHTVLLLSLTSLSSFASSFEQSAISPPDTTTNVVNRSASLLILEDGKKIYTEGRVRDALIKFRQAAVKDPNSWKPPYWISLCHYQIDNYGFALQYATEAIKKSSAVDKEVYELLGKTYHRLGFLDSAIVNYEIAMKVMSKTALKYGRVEEKINACKFAQEQLKRTPFAEKKILTGNVNSGFNDYAPLVTNGGKEMYFASRRSNTTGGGLNPEEGQYFEDIYHAKWNQDQQIWDSVTNNLDRLNGFGFEAFSYISEDGLSGYLTINNEAVDEKISTRSSDIFEVQFSNKGKWSNPKKINNKTINTSYFDASATVTADGNTMYFVSNRNEEKRKTDIYVVEKVGKSWGNAVAMSDSINTPGNETTPFISPDGRFLFFSSDYHLGMGGYDIFVSENLGNAWSKPINLGAAINSVNDDTHFVHYGDLKKAYFSTFVLVGQRASMDIFEIDMTNFVMPRK